MRLSILSLLFMLPLLLAGQKYDSPSRTDSVYIFVDAAPRFPGGDEEMYRYIEEQLFLQLSTPLLDRMNESGSYDCLVKFVVDRQGKISGAGMDNRSRDFYLSDDIIRIINNMPVWQPGKVQGEAVNTLVYLKLEIENGNSYPQIHYHPLYPDSAVWARKKMNKKQKRYAILAAILLTGLLFLFSSRGIP